ncbi:MAG: hypothetical protein QF864_09270 [SAR202 cluster bacterium]|jgi:hypothetical protein|nr:hypothetical protein [SAR202 cluster bacterium]
MSEVYQTSPNRVEDHRVHNAIECLANFVEMIPEVHIGFEDGIFFLDTQRYGAVNDLSIHADLQNELDLTAKNAEKYLKDDGFSGVKVTPVSFEVTPMGWGSGVHNSTGTAGRQLLYTARGTYEFTANP